MLFGKNTTLLGMKASRFVDNFMILYTTVNLVKLMENEADYEENEMAQHILNATLNELFKTVLILDDGLWN